MTTAVYTYGALGAGIAWFILQAIFLSFWPGFIHSKFAKGIHGNWMMKDVLPMMMSSMVVLIIMKNLDIDFFSFGRVEIFIILLVFGEIVLIVNSLVAKDVRDMILNRWGKSR
jgi:hypothetical protein